MVSSSNLSSHVVDSQANYSQEIKVRSSRIVLVRDASQHIYSQHKNLSTDTFPNHWHYSKSRM